MFCQYGRGVPSPHSTYICHNVTVWQVKKAHVQTDFRSISFVDLLPRQGMLYQPILSVLLQSPPRVLCFFENDSESETATPACFLVPTLAENIS